jgi:hypothetical protein
MERTRELEISIEKLKHRVEDIEEEVRRMRCCVESSDQRSPGQYLGTVALIHVYTFGAAVGSAISWSLNRSVAWSILHGLGSWLYVAYSVFGFEGR